MNGHRQIRLHQLDKLDPLLRVHGDHHQRHMRTWDRRATEVDQHEVDRLARVRVHFRYLLEITNVQGVTGNVDPVPALEGLGLRGCREAEFEPPAVRGTAPRMSLAFESRPSPTCLPGMPVMRMRGRDRASLDPEKLTNMSSQASRAWTAVKDSPFCLVLRWW